MAETMAMPKMTAIVRNRTHIEKCMAHADNLVNNRREFLQGGDMENFEEVWRSFSKKIPAKNGVKKSFI